MAVLFSWLFCSLDLFRLLCVHAGWNQYYRANWGHNNNPWKRACVQEYMWLRKLSFDCSLCIVRFNVAWTLLQNYSFIKRSGLLLGKNFYFLLNFGKRSYFPCFISIFDKNRGHNWHFNKPWCFIDFEWLVKLHW